LDKISFFKRGGIVQSDLREKFLKVYSNLPLKLRDEIILVLDDEPITWRVAYLEVKNETKLGKEILKRLFKLKII